MPAYDGSAVRSSAVSFRSVVALVDRFPVLAGADLEIERGRTLLVTGANGAGKTSLLRAIAGLLPIAGGEGRVLGYDLVVDRRAARAGVAFLGHQSALHDELTVEENITFTMRAARRNGRVDVASILDRVGLAKRVADLPVALLSAGQRRRAALGAVVARDNELWLLDEPEAALDAEGRELLGQILVDARQRGRTIVFTSHQPSGQSSRADAVVEVAGGVVVPVPQSRSYGDSSRSEGPVHVA